MKRFYFIFAWMLLGIGVFFSSAAALHLYSVHQPLGVSTATAQAESTDNQAASDDTQPLAVKTGQVRGISTLIETEDARVQIVANFLERHNSPLEPYDHFGQVFVDIADRYEFDFRLLPAIAMQESNLCKKIPPGSYNCLGFGIHSRGTLMFDSFEANFERAGRELKKNYIDQGRTTPEQIMRKYTPSSNGSWANSVNQWMAEMRYNDRQRGREEEYDGNVMEFAQSASDSAQTN